jgi:HAD superfamily hydrolase (TIGR01549 family)
VEINGDNIGLPPARSAKFIRFGEIPASPGRSLMKRNSDLRIRTVKAVIFDLDDTLVESTVNFPKFKRLVIERILSYGEKEADYNPGETVVAIIDRFEGRMAKKGVPETEARRRLAELDKIMDTVEMERVSETTAYGGAARLLDLLRMNGIKVGILTRGCQEYADSALARTRLTYLVDAVECRNSKTKAKPNPEAYLKLVKAIGVRKEETVFVGDHPIDGQCAASAGVPFIGVLTGDVPEKALRAAGAVEVFTDVGQMAEWLQDILNS